MVDPLESRPMLPPPAARPYHPFVVVPRAFGARQCERLRAMADTVEMSDAGLQHDGGSAEDVAIRRSEVAWLAPEPDTDWIYRRMARIAESANRHYGFELTGFAEDVQLTSYDGPGSFYTWHLDGLDVGVAQRKLSIVVQLSDPDDYDGGVLEFLPVATDYDDEQRDEHRRSIGALGTAVVFPSFEYHRVTPLTRGRRLSLVSWVSGPPFR